MTQGFLLFISFLLPNCQVCTLVFYSLRIILLHEWIAKHLRIVLKLIPGLQQVIPLEIPRNHLPKQKQRKQNQGIYCKIIRHNIPKSKQDNKTDEKNTEQLISKSTATSTENIEKQEETKESSDLSRSNSQTINRSSKGNYDAEKRQRIRDEKKAKKYRAAGISSSSYLSIINS